MGQPPDDNVEVDRRLFGTWRFTEDSRRGINNFFFREDE